MAAHARKVTKLKYSYGCPGIPMAAHARKVTKLKYSYGCHGIPMAAHARKVTKLKYSYGCPGIPMAAHARKVTKQKYSYGCPATFIWGRRRHYWFIQYFCTRSWAVHGYVHRLLVGGGREVQERPVLHGLQLVPVEPSKTGKLPLCEGLYQKPLRARATVVRLLLRRISLAVVLQRRGVFCRSTFGSTVLRGHGNACRRRRGVAAARGCVVLVVAPCSPSSMPLSRALPPPVSRRRARADDGRREGDAFW